MARFSPTRPATDARRSICPRPPRGPSSSPSDARWPPRAWSPARASAFWAASSCSPAASDGFARFCRTSSTKKSPSPFSRSPSHRLASLVDRIRLSPRHRARLPVETYPVISGIKGGIAGGIAMIGPALLYGLIAQHSIWYPVNLLGGAGVAALEQSHHRGDCRLSLAKSAHRHRHPLAHLPAGRSALRRHAAHVAAPSRFCSAAFLRPFCGRAFCIPSWASSIPRSPTASRGVGFWFRRSPTESPRELSLRVRSAFLPVNRCPLPRAWALKRPA